MCRGCKLYFCADELFVVTEIGDQTGLQTGGKPWLKLDRRVSNDELGRAVFAALDASHDGMNDEAFSSAQKAFLEFIGARDWRALERTWDCIHVYRDRETNSIVVDPYRRNGPGSGYLGSPVDSLWRGKEPSAEALGEVLRGMLNNPPRPEKRAR